jgi:uncharacterized repeat protein (TIGR03803 family)
MSRVSRSLLLASVALGLGFTSASAKAPYSIIHDFVGPSQHDGDKPQSKLVADSQGRLYGVTQLGGTNSSGSVFRLTKTGKTWSEETLFSFPAGSGPNGTLLIGASGELYGTTLSGGIGQGTVYRLDPNGSTWTLTTLHQFNPTGSHDGFLPSAGLVFGKDGLLYGTTKGAPPQDGQTAKQDPMYGTVFSISPMGDTVEYSVLHIFGGTNDGQFPGFGSLVVDKKGVLTGTTGAGGRNTEGMVFQLTPPKSGQRAWGETSIYDFKSTGLDAIGPFYGVVAGKGGVLFGCANGGNNGSGVVYALTPPPKHSASWSEQLLYSFGDQANDPKSNAVCDVSVSKQGVLFGAASGGGVNGTGAIFRIAPPVTGQTAWAEMVLHSFGLQGTGDATFPSAAPIEVGKQVLGVAPSGGAFNRGAVFEVQP